MSLGRPYAPYLPPALRDGLSVVDCPTIPGELCWVWTGPRTADGYGRARRRGRPFYAHRWAYAASGRRLDEGATIDHLCRVPACANPAHLTQVSREENARRAAAARRAGAAYEGRST